MPRVSRWRRGLAGCGFVEIGERRGSGAVAAVRIADGGDGLRGLCLRLLRGELELACGGLDLDEFSVLGRRCDWLGLGRREEFRDLGLEFREVFPRGFERLRRLVHALARIGEFPLRALDGLLCGRGCRLRCRVRVRGRFLCGLGGGGTRRGRHGLGDRQLLFPRREILVRVDDAVFRAPEVVAEMFDLPFARRALPAGPRRVARGLGLDERLCRAILRGGGLGLRIAGGGKAVAAERKNGLRLLLHLQDSRLLFARQLLRVGHIVEESARARLHKMGGVFASLVDRRQRLGLRLRDGLLLRRSLRRRVFPHLPRKGRELGALPVFQLRDLSADVLQRAQILFERVGLRFADLLHDFAGAIGAHLPGGGLCIRIENADG